MDRKLLIAFLQSKGIDTSKIPDSQYLGAEDYMNRVDIEVGDDRERRLRSIKHLALSGFGIQQDFDVMEFAQIVDPYFAPSKKKAQPTGSGGQQASPSGAGPSGGSGVKWVDQFTQPLQNGGTADPLSEAARAIGSAGAQGVGGVGEPLINRMPEMQAQALKEQGVPDYMLYNEKQIEEAAKRDAQQAGMEAFPSAIEAYKEYYQNINKLGPVGVEEGRAKEVLSARLDAIKTDPRWQQIEEAREQAAKANLQWAQTMRKESATEDTGGNMFSPLIESITKPIADSELGQLVQRGIEAIPTQEEVAGAVFGELEVDATELSPAQIQQAEKLYKQGEQLLEQAKSQQSDILKEQYRQKAMGLIEQAKGAGYGKRVKNRVTGETMFATPENIIAYTTEGTPVNKQQVRTNFLRKTNGSPQAFALANSAMNIAFGASPQEQQADVEQGRVMQEMYENPATPMGRRTFALPDETAMSAPDVARQTAIDPYAELQGQRRAYERTVARDQLQKALLGGDIKEVQDALGYTNIVYFKQSEEEMKAQRAFRAKMNEAERKQYDLEVFGTTQPSWLERNIARPVVSATGQAISGTANLGVDIINNANTAYHTWTSDREELKQRLSQSPTRRWVTDQKEYLADRFSPFPYESGIADLVFNQVPYVLAPILLSRQVGATSARLGNVMGRAVGPATATRLNAIGNVMRSNSLPAAFGIAEADFEGAAEAYINGDVSKFRALAVPLLQATATAGMERIGLDKMLSKRGVKNLVTKETAADWTKMYEEARGLMRDMRQTPGRARQMLEAGFVEWGTETLQQQFTDVTSNEFLAQSRDTDILDSAKDNFAAFVVGTILKGFHPSATTRQKKAEVLQAYDNWLKQGQIPAPLRETLLTQVSKDLAVSDLTAEEQLAMAQTPYDVQRALGLDKSQTNEMMKVQQRVAEQGFEGDYRQLLDVESIDGEPLVPLTKEQRAILNKSLEINPAEITIQDYVAYEQVPSAEEKASGDAGVGAVTSEGKNIGYATQEIIDTARTKDIPLDEAAKILYPEIDLSDITFVERQVVPLEEYVPPRSLEDVRNVDPSKLGDMNKTLKELEEETGPIPSTPITTMTREDLNKKIADVQASMGETTQKEYIKYLQMVRDGARVASPTALMEQEAKLAKRLFGWTEKVPEVLNDWRITSNKAKRIVAKTALNVGRIAIPQLSRSTEQSRAKNRLSGKSDVAVQDMGKNLNEHYNLVGRNAESLARVQTAMDPDTGLKTASRHSTTVRSMPDEVREQVANDTDVYLNLTHESDIAQRNEYKVLNDFEQNLRKMTDEEVMQLAREAGTVVGESTETVAIDLPNTQGLRRIDPKTKDARAQAESIVFDAAFAEAKKRNPDIELDRRVYEKLAKPWFELDPARKQVVYDLEAELPSYNDLTQNERILYDALRTHLDYIHDTNFELGVIDEATYDKYKGNYTPRFYEEYVMGKVVPVSEEGGSEELEARVAELKGYTEEEYERRYNRSNNSLAGVIDVSAGLQMRKPLGTIEEAPLMDPVYATFDRYAQLERRKAIEEYAEEMRKQGQVLTPQQMYEKLAEVESYREELEGLVQGIPAPQEVDDAIEATIEEGGDADMMEQKATAPWNQPAVRKKMEVLAEKAGYSYLTSKPVAKGSNKRYNPYGSLTGNFVTDIVADDLMGSELLRNVLKTQVGQFFMGNSPLTRFRNISKMVHTVFSPATVMFNFLSNYTFGAMAGIGPIAMQRGNFIAGKILSDNTPDSEMYRRVSFMARLFGPNVMGDGGVKMGQLNAFDIYDLSAEEVAAYGGDPRELAQEIIDEVYRTLSEAGVLQSSVITSDIQQEVARIQKRGKEARDTRDYYEDRGDALTEKYEKKLEANGVDIRDRKSALQRVKDFAIDFYTAADDMTKVSAFVNLKRRRIRDFKWKNKRTPTAEEMNVIDKGVIDDVLASFQNYKAVGRAYDVAAGFEVASPFVKFKADLLRILSNNIRKHPLTMMALANGMGALSKLTFYYSREWDSDDEFEKAWELAEKQSNIKRIGPDIVVGGIRLSGFPATLYFGDTMIDFGRAFAVNYHRMSEGENDPIAILDTVFPLVPFSDYGSEGGLPIPRVDGFVLGAALDMATDRNFMGKSIRNPTKRPWHPANAQIETPEAQALNLVDYAMNAWVPYYGTIKGWYSTIAGEPNQYGYSYTPLQYIARRMGFKVRDYDPNIEGFKTYYYTAMKKGFELKNEVEALEMWLKTHYKKDYVKPFERAQTIEQKERITKKWLEKAYKEQADRIEQIKEKERELLQWEKDFGYLFQREEVTAANVQRHGDYDENQRKMIEMYKQMQREVLKEKGQDEN